QAPERTLGDRTTAPAFPDRRDVERALGAALAKGADFAEIFLESDTLESVRIEEQVVREAARGVELGAGVRAISGEKVGYAYTDGADPADIIEAAKVAGEIATGGGRVKVAKLKGLTSAPSYSAPRVLPSTLTPAAKVEIAWATERAARAHDRRIKEVLVALADNERTTLVANTEGTYVTGRRVLTSLRVTTVAEQAGLRQRGFRSLSGTSGYELLEGQAPANLATDAAQHAVMLLGAEEAPAGKMMLVLARAGGAVFFHEAIGHGFEADFIRKKASLFAGRMGERVASEGCTIVDDGTVAGKRGTIGIDDEGTPGQRTVLVEKGMLKSYLYDKLNAKLMGAASTGNGRRESYRSVPVPRMTNTMLLAGAIPPEEILASVKHGFYAKHMGGGQVDVSSGNFVFEVTEGYLIENGKIASPVRGANLIGNGGEILKKIDMVGSDFQHYDGWGTCGKAGQGVPVSDGMPTIRVSEITIGGTKS
ncbi:MAG: metallopeptidase TldD-related protein, partial [bacterium]